MKQFRIAVVALAGALDIYVETDVSVQVPEEEETEGEEMSTSNPLMEIPPSVKRIFDISRVRKFDSILEFTTWLHEEEAVVSRMVIL